MRSKTGTVCMFFGAALIFGALSIFLYNWQEAENARRASEAHLAQLVEILKPLEDRGEGEDPAQWDDPLLDLLPPIPEDLLKPEDLIMTETTIDGNTYIGYLSLPTLNLDLPILSDWS